VYSGFWGAVSGSCSCYYNKYIHPASLSITASAEGLLASSPGVPPRSPADRRRGDRDDSEELRFRLHRALEHAARIRVRLHRDLYAGGVVPGVRRLAAQATKAWRSPR